MSSETLILTGGRHLRLDTDRVVATRDLVVSIAAALTVLPRAEGYSCVQPGSDEDNLLQCVAAALVQLAGPTVDGATSDPSRNCLICDTPFRTRALSARDVHMVGDTRFCPVCCRDAVNGVLADEGRELTWLPAAVWAIRAVSEHEFSGPPPSRAQLEAPLRGPADDKITKLITRMLIPRSGLPAFQPARKPYSWIEWLQVADVLGDGIRQMRGTWTTASDGHLCRSLFERHIDDFLHHHDVTHEPEPHYPYDDELNLTGLRADWRLTDGTLVEAAGLAGNPDYDHKLLLKSKLAGRHNLRLVVITPNDLGRLGDILQPWIGNHGATSGHSAALHREASSTEDVANNPDHP